MSFVNIVEMTVHETSSIYYAENLELTKVDTHRNIRE